MQNRMFILWDSRIFKIINRLMFPFQNTCIYRWGIGKLEEFRMILHDTDFPARSETCCHPFLVLCSDMRWCYISNLQLPREAINKIWRSALCSGSREPEWRLLHWAQGNTIYFKWRAIKHLESWGNNYIWTYRGGRGKITRWLWQSFTVRSSADRLQPQILQRWC